MSCFSGSCTLSSSRKPPRLHTYLRTHSASSMPAPLTTHTHAHTTISPSLWGLSSSMCVFPHPSRTSFCGVCCVLAALTTTMRVSEHRRLLWGGSPALDQGDGHLGAGGPGIPGFCTGGSGCSSLCLGFCLFRMNFSHLAKRLLQVFQEECVQKYQASLVTHGKRMR